jgi:hypothetical protein
MLNDSLKEELAIPHLSGTLVAEILWKGVFERAKADSQTLEERDRLCVLYADETRLENYYFRWRISFWLDGPDRRYNGDGSSVDPLKIPDLIRDFETALAIIRELSNTRFAGTYNKRIGSSAAPELAVTGSDGVFKLKFSLSNDRWTLSRLLPADDIERAIGQLTYSLSRGPELIDTLRSIVEANRPLKNAV